MSTPIIIGIDYSLHNTSICITEGFKDFKFYSTFNPSTDKLKQFVAQHKGFDFDILHKDLYLAGHHYSEKESIRLSLYEVISDNVIRYIKNNITDFENRNIIIGIEGQAYNTKNTSSLVDIAQGTGILKHKLLMDILKGSRERLFVFTPTELKNIIGAKGNADKGVIFDAFIKDPMIAEVKDTVFYKHVSSNISQIRKSSIKTKTVTKKIKKESVSEVVQIEKVEIASPYNDIIDAYLSVLKICEMSK